MVVKNKIEKVLKRLQKEYNNNIGDQELSIVFSKIALIELCGWIEESIKDIAERRICAKKRSNIDFYYKENSINQFKYKSFRKRICLVIGINKFEKLEKSIDSAVRDKLESDLDTLQKMRNDNAHNSIVGVMSTIPAPSIIINYFQSLHSGLKNIEKNIKKL